MARIFLNSGETTGPIGGRSADTITGTNDSETVYVAGNGKAVFTADFNRGGDTIYIDGAAGDYRATINSSNTQLTLTAANGANIIVPIGTNGTDIIFNDDDVRELVFDTDLETVLFGDQELDGGSTVDVDDGDDVPNPDGDTFRLSATRDDLEGTGGDDLFRARVSQNQNGEQTNELGTGDFIDGGAGDDELFATVQDASALNGGPGSEIAPVTVDVETIRITAQQAGPSFDTDAIEISAEEMYGVERIISYRSDASLTFYNVNTLEDEPTPGENLDEGARPTSSIEVCMEYTAGDNGLFPASDMCVLFDNDFLIPEGPGPDTNFFRIQILDIDNQITSNRPLTTNPFGIIVLSFDDGTTTQLLIDESGYSSDLTGVAAYQAFIEAINDAFEGAGLDNLSASLGVPFSVVDPDNDQPAGNVANGFEIVITDSSGESVTGIDFGALDIVPANTDYQKQVFFGDIIAERPLIEVDVCLEKVGNGGDGGGLVVGAMSETFNEDDQREYNGIQQFNVTLSGTDAQDSSLAYLSSTYNALERVYVVAEAGSGADLTIGNEHTFSHEDIFGEDGEINCFGFDGVPNGADDDEDCDVVDERNNALTDVIIFDASALGADNDVTLWANLSDQFADKYLDLRDTQANPAADNQNAQYLFGAGDDTLSMSVSSTNVAYDGMDEEDVGNVTREDFFLTIDMGAGDDTVLFQIGDGSLNPEPSDTDNWYVNHLLNENVSITTGAGDDFVNTWGSTAAIISTGDGADVIYTDNSGVLSDGRGEDGECFNCGMATWVFNAENNDVYDLRSSNAVTLSNAANLAVQVQYMDFVVTANIAGTTGSVNGVTVTDLMVNQAIKDAINNNPVLSDFLVAEDGPGRTLVVRSLVDGSTAVNDLTVSLVSSGALSAAQIAGTSLTIGTDPTTSFTAAQLSALGFTVTGTPIISDGDADIEGRYDPEFGFDSECDVTLDGEDSVNINNNRVEGGLGNDEIALSSATGSIEHVIISGVFSSLSEPGFGDHILNFSAGEAGIATDPVQEVQTLTFAVDTATDADDDGFDETEQDANIVVDIDGTDYTVVIPAGSEADDIADLVATAIAADSNVETAVASTDGSGVVTITYVTGENYPQATADVVASDATEIQQVIVAGTQVDAATVTIEFAGETFEIPIPAGSTIQQTESIIVTFIQNAGFPDISASIDNDGDPATVGDATLDGTFTLLYFGAEDIDEAVITVTSPTTQPDQTYAVDTLSDFVAFDPGITVTEETTTDGAPALTGLQDYDIFDLSAIIGDGGPEFFFNNANFGADDDAAGTDTAAGEEYATINALIDSNSNGVVLIDTVDADTRTELQELQAMVTAADNGTNAPAGTTDTSVIITVQSAPASSLDDDGVYGDFYQVIDGAAAGDATVSYLGRVYLGGTEEFGKEDIGNFEALGIENFTPLSPSDIIDSFGSII